MSARSSSRAGRVRPSIQGAVVRTVIALLHALWVFAPFTHWTVEWRMARYTAPYLLDPRTGFLGLALVLFLVLTVPGWLRGRRQPPSEPTPGGTGRARRRTLDHGRPVGVPVPTRSFGELSSAQRRQMAAALRMSWSATFVHDDRAWRRACERALQERADEIRG